MHLVIPDFKEFPGYNLDYVFFNVQFSLIKILGKIVILQQRGCSECEAHLSRVIVPQLVVKAVRMSFLPLDLSDDIKHFRVRAAGAGATTTIRLTLGFTGTLICITHTFNFRVLKVFGVFFLILYYLFTKC